MLLGKQLKPEAELSSCGLAWRHRKIIHLKKHHLRALKKHQSVKLIVDEQCYELRLNGMPELFDKDGKKVTRTELKRVLAKY